MKARWIENQYRNRKLMKLSKSLIIAALVAGSLFTGSALLQAQTTTNTPPAGAPAGGPRGPGMRGGGPSLDVIATALKLDDATKAKVKTILDARDQKLKDLRPDSTAHRKIAGPRCRPSATDVDTQMKAVLTADQYAQWEKMTQPRQRRAAPAAAPAAARPPRRYRTAIIFVGNTQTGTATRRPFLFLTQIAICRERRVKLCRGVLWHPPLQSAISAPGDAG